MAIFSSEALSNKGFEGLAPSLESLPGVASLPGPGDLVLEQLVPAWHSPTVGEPLAHY